MGMLDGLWHLLNFFAPAFALGALAALLTKVLWRRQLQTVGWLRLAAGAVAASTVALIVGLVLTGSDGKMITYGGMVLACTASLWWTAFGPRRG